MKMTASYMYNKCIHKYIFDEQMWWEKGGKGIECKCRGGSRIACAGGGDT
jgi:hypothetical protein